MRWKSFAVGFASATVIAALLWIAAAWPWHTIYIYGEMPKITDWVQAIGTIIAILLSTVIAIAVPLWTRYLKRQRYRSAILRVVHDMLDCIEQSILPLDAPDTSYTKNFPRLWDQGDRLARLRPSLSSLPVVLAENPFAFDCLQGFEDSIKACQEALQEGIDLDPHGPVEKKEAYMEHIRFNGVFAFLDAEALARSFGQDIEDDGPLPKLKESTDIFCHNHRALA